jgi:superfamily II DNA or RNA helicase
METDYKTFLDSKKLEDLPTGLPSTPPLNPMLFDFQRDIVRWALRRGRAAIFADCGMGKTPMQLEWARHIPGPVLIAAPLAVSSQTVREGKKFGIDVTRARQQEEANPEGITITNYEMLHKFDPTAFAGIVLDESSILKSYTGKTKQELVQLWSRPPYRLACTATPAPNDYMELGNHSEFLGIMRGSEMLASFFINDPGHVGHYRLKGHAEAPFWRWMASWAVMIRQPSDLGYDNGAFQLPPCHFRDICIDANAAADGMLFALTANTMQERRQARKATISGRVNEAARIANSTKEPCLVWCDLNRESAMLTAAIDGAVEVKGSDSMEHKETALEGFARGAFRVLVSKPSIAGWGMNYQHCRNVIFTGLSDSYEQFYQAVRRCWRFGQLQEVNCYIVTDRTEGAVVANIHRKERDAMEMAERMSREMAYISQGAIRQDIRFAKTYIAEKQMEIPSWLKVS